MHSYGNTAIKLKLARMQLLASHLLLLRLLAGPLLGPEGCLEQLRPSAQLTVLDRSKQH
jgi:hypothetical protein